MRNSPAFFLLQKKGSWRWSGALRTATRRNKIAHHFAYASANYDVRL